MLVHLQKTLPSLREAKGGKEAIDLSRKFNISDAVTDGLVTYYLPVNGKMVFKNQVIVGNIKIIISFRAKPDLTPDAKSEDKIEEDFRGNVIARVATGEKVILFLKEQQCIDIINLAKHDFSVFKEEAYISVYRRSQYHSFWSNLEVLYKNYLAGGFYENLRNKLAERVITLAKDKGISCLEVLSAGCGTGKDLECIANLAWKEGLLFTGLGFDVNNSCVKQAQTISGAGLKFVQGDMLQLEEIYRQNAFFSQECTSLKIAIFSGSLTREVIDGTADAVKILQQASHCIDMAVCVGFQELLVSNPLAKKIGWDVVQENIAIPMVSDKEALYILKKMQDVERVRWLQKKLQKCSNVLDLSLSANPLNDLRLVINHIADCVEKIKVIDLRKAYLREADIPRLRELLSVFPQVGKLLCVKLDVINQNIASLRHKNLDVIIDDELYDIYEIPPKLPAVKEIDATVITGAIGYVTDELDRRIKRIQAKNATGTAPEEIMLGLQKLDILRPLKEAIANVTSLSGMSKLLRDCIANNPILNFERTYSGKFVKFCGEFFHLPVEVTTGSIKTLGKCLVHVAQLSAIPSAKPKV